MLSRVTVLCLLTASMGVGACAQQSETPGSSSMENAGATSASKSYTLPPGTHILLSLKSEVSTRSARPGDPVYCISQFPVVQSGVVVIPGDTYVKGVIQSVQRAGKVKGRAQVQLHFTSLLFPNGTEIPLPGTLDNVPGSTGADVKNAEGTIEQSSSKGQDTQRVANTTMAGAGVGSLAGWAGGDAAKGLGIGAGAGAAAGVLTTLMTRGKDIVIPSGSTVEMVLDRPVTIEQRQLTGMSGYTGIRP